MEGMWQPALICYWGLPDNMLTNYSCEEGGGGGVF